MDSPAVVYAGRWLIRDTFCQALTSRVFWLMLGTSAVCILFCLSVSVEGPRTLRPEGESELYGPDHQPLTGANPAPGHMTLLFGVARVELFRDVESEVHFLQAVFGSWVAGVVGVLLALMWTAGFVPESLQANVAAVQMTRPVPRWVILVGKYLGVVLFVAFQAAIFFVGTWAALGVKTGVWRPHYLLGLPILVVHFAAFYSVSVYLATLTRSTTASAFGTVIFWALCLGVNYGRCALIALPAVAPTASPPPAAAVWTLDAAYWALPKPADYVLALEGALETNRHQAALSSAPEFRAALDKGAFAPGLSLLTAVGFTAVLCFLGSWQLRETEY
jgi:ABC-type transport system involved in multi-copper enzyme maturation permease subunit